MSTRFILSLAVLFASKAIAAPIDFTTGIITGVQIVQGPFNLRDGAFLDSPLLQLVDSRPYTAQIVPTGSDATNESFVAIAGDRQLGFASALSTGAGALEVGAENGLRFNGFHTAFSRWFMTIKNNTDGDIGFDYLFHILPGEVTLLGGRDDDFKTAHLRAEAFIDFLLLSPKEDDPGTFDETKGRLFDYFLDFDDFNKTGDFQTHSPNASVLCVNTTLTNRCTSLALDGKVELPTIPGRGELTVFYDMFAHMNVIKNEKGAIVMLGDPTDVVGGTPGRLVRRSVTAVAEPGTVVLFAAGLAGVLGRQKALSRRRPARIRSHSRRSDSGLSRSSISKPIPSKTI